MNYTTPPGDFSIPMTAPTSRVNIQAIMRLVYVWMGLGLLVSAIVAWFTATNESMLQLAIQLQQGPMFIVTFLVMIGVVVAISAGVNSNRVSPNLAMLLFFFYAAFIGFIFSVIFIVFGMSEIVMAYGTTVVLFGVMSIFGFTTSMDLTKWGTYLLMGLVGLIAVSFVNMLFLGGGSSLLISIAGVIIFTGLTAYDTQKIKEFAETHGGSGDTNLVLKFSIYGALILYMDFINLFLYLLSIFSGRRD